MKRAIMVVAGFCLLTQSPMLAQEPEQLRFDAGPRTHVVEGATPLAVDDEFNEDRGFGWLLAPEEEFFRSGLSAARSNFEVDGVSGSQLVFRANLPNGRWWTTLWLEAGMEDSTSMSLQINGAEIDLDWHVFNPPSEPRTDIQSIYRMYHGSTSVADGAIVIDMTGGADLVRLLGITLTPDPVLVDPDLLARIKTMGAYGPNLRLEEIMGGEESRLVSLANDLRSAADSDPNNAFAAYWSEQIDILRAAETNIRLMGWEWATDSTNQGIFDRFHQAVMQLDALLDRPDRESYPLYERALFQRGRLHHWLYRERGGENTRIQGEIDLAEMLARHPTDELLSMYNGTQIRTPSPCDELNPDPSSPKWSQLQLEALCRLRSEIHWWVNERQSETGEFGGKIGDDVELFRWWPPVVLSGDTTAFLGWKRLADGVMVTRKVHQGYSRRPIDVEHASEFISDTAPEMVFYSDDPEYVDRLRFSADYFENLWTGFSPEGRRYFRSAWFSSTEVDERPPRDRDLEYNTRAVKAVRYLAWKTGDPEVVRSLHEWSSAWRHASMRTDKGKPLGIVPASIRLSDEAINGDEPTWHIANMFWTYFDWDHSCGSMMLDQLLFTYTLTGDERLLDPMFAAADLVSQFEKQGWSDDEEVGEASAEWAASRIKDESSFWNTLSQWRFQTGDARYDELLARFGTPYTRYRLTGDEGHLVEGLRQLLDEIRYNRPLRTTEVLHTDRVRTPGAMHLKAMLTGDGTNEGSSPYYAVSWQNTSEGFTALVTDATSESLELQILDHSSQRSTTADLRVWKLTPGVYNVAQRPDAHAMTARVVEIKQRGQTIPITVSGGVPTTIQFERKP